MNVYDDFLLDTGREDRLGQREAVRLLLELSSKSDAEHYAIQAPTGTGKSYAALIAGVENARMGRRTVVGTSTIVLSDQYSEDMKLVASVFPDVKFAVLKGASNYFCGNKTAEALAAVKNQERKKVMMQELVAFRKGLTTSLPIWAVSDTEYCSGCSNRLTKAGKTTCEYADARAKALLADVVITTHAMIYVDLRMRTRSKSSKSESGILGTIWLTILDEAHLAFKSFTYNEVFGQRQLRAMDFHGLLQSMSYARRIAFVDHITELKDAGKWVNPTADLARSALACLPTAYELNDMSTRIETSAADRDKRRLHDSVSFLYKMQEILKKMANGEFDGTTALWVRDGSYKLQEMVPSEGTVDRLLARRIAWVSATLGTKSRPRYVLDKCGVGPHVTLFDLPSPFDYKKSLSWTIRTDSKAPDEGRLISAINSHWDGGMVILTPFHKRKTRIAERCSATMPTELVQDQTQGSGTGVANSAALQSHCTAADLGGRPVLVGVEVFSTGVDLPGNRLTKLVIAGLFPLRDDPAYSAWRGRWLSRFGGDGFTGYELPERAIVLEQQIGRVVRRPDDSGIVVLYVEDKDGKSGSKGMQIITEALARFPGAVSV